MATSRQARAGATRATAEDDRSRRRFQDIAENLRLRILEGRLKVGDKLPSERDLSEEFGVGRSSVREAIFILSRLGLVSVVRGGGIRVTDPDPNVIFRDFAGVAQLMLRTPVGVRELQQVRNVVESGLAREAAIRAPQQSIAMIRRALKDNERSIGDQERFIATDVGFHRSIAVAVGNSVFLAALDGLNDWLFEQRRVSASHGVPMAEVFAQHEQIFLAIETRDGMRAHAAMERHLLDVARNYWNAAMYPQPGGG